jgi:hypothetical protein
MATHAHAPAIAENGLQDGCDRCAEMAADPFGTLDDSNFARLFVRTERWMLDESDAMPRSKNELAAMRTMETALRRADAIERARRASLTPTPAREPDADGLYYEPPYDGLSGTVFDPSDETFGPIMASLQAGEFEQTLDLVAVLAERGA